MNRRALRKAKNGIFLSLSLGATLTAWRAWRRYFGR